VIGWIAKGKHSKYHDGVPTPTKPRLAACDKSRGRADYIFILTDKYKLLTVNGFL
jgi:hypothetical protein